METTQRSASSEKEAFARQTEELVAIAELPPGDTRRLEAFIRVRSLLVQIRPELERIFCGLFEKGRHTRDARTFLGRMREVLGTKLTKEEFRLLLEARDIPGFSIIQTFIEDATYPEEKPPVTERVIREIPPITSPTPLGGRAPMCCPNIGGLPD